MTDHSIPKPVSELICDRIHSIEQLELVLLLHGSKPDSWTPKRAAAALRIAEALVVSALNHLTSRGIVTAEGEHDQSFRYSPVEVEIAKQVEELVTLYPRARLEIVMLISRCAMERIRTSQVRMFAQAFLLKQPKRES